MRLRGKGRIQVVVRVRPKEETWKPLLSTGRPISARGPEGKSSLVGKSNSVLYTKIWRWNVHPEGKLGPLLSSVEELARKHGKTMAQIALAWIMAKDGEQASASLFVALGSIESILNCFCQRSRLQSWVRHHLRSWRTISVSCAV